MEVQKTKWKFRKQNGRRENQMKVQKTKKAQNIQQKRIQYGSTKATGIKENKSKALKLRQRKQK